MTVSYAPVIETADGPVRAFDATRFGATAPQQVYANEGSLPDVPEPIIAGDSFLNMNVWTTGASGAPRRCGRRPGWPKWRLGSVDTITHTRKSLRTCGHHPTAEDVMATTTPTPAPAPTPAPTATPNLYQLQGLQLHITFATSGIGGKPHFTYQDAQQALHFSGDQIRTAATEIGTLVTVTIRLTVDAGSTSFTLLVPRVNLDQTRHAAITTEGITTLHRFSIFPPANHGQTELYTVTRLSGTASAVDF